MFSAQQIARELGQHAPTAQQQAVIEAPPQGTYRVIAGAGSGKTETMAQRVVWLVANDYVKPHEVLGLTFTRKAAGELGHRISERLTQLQQRDMAPEMDEFQRPQVSTYNSFASRLYREHAVILGLDPDAQVLSEASAWSLARSVVSSSSLPALASFDTSLNELTRVVRLLAQRVADNQVDRADLSAFVQKFQSLGTLPAGGRGQYADVDKWVGSVSDLEPLLDLVQEYTRAKRLRGVVEFSDQVFLAASLIAHHPEVTGQVRQANTAVLLDEYQDTSVSQTTLLSALFSGHPVMAVGDPNQAIYGWRGASSANLTDFEHAFGSEVTTFTLSTSWRNGTQILAAANAVAMPLRSLPGPPVGELLPAPTASSAALEACFEQTLEEEAVAVATWFQERLAVGDQKAPSAALIMRQRHHQRVFVDALREVGVPVHVLGIGGLLDDPAIADLVCALRVVASPGAETELVRLLAGAKWRIGVAELHALSRTARWLQGRDEYGSLLSEELRQRLSESVSSADHQGLWDALGFVVTAPADHTVREAFSEETLARFHDAHTTLHGLSQLRLADLDELVHAIEQALGLDVEILAHPHKDRYLAAKETFFDALHSYQSLADAPSVSGFVHWLSEAERRDNLTPRAEEPEPGCVQVLTIHGAKGLEWDAVCIPRLVEEEMPSAPRETKGWLYRGELPYPFRGDASSLPRLEWEVVETRKEMVDAVEAFQEDVREHRLWEERRLMYVAITRARHHVLLSGSFWAHHQKHRGPSRFLRELEAAGLVGALPLAPLSEVPPERDLESTRVWPGDPLGTRRASVEAAALLVQQAMQRPLREPHDEEVTRLAAEREKTAGHDSPTALTSRVRISASSLEALATGAQQYWENLERPVPQKPHRAALRGTLFHQYVEQRLGVDVAVPFVDFDTDSTMPSEGNLGIEHWIEAFEASEFAHQTPVAIEAELHMPLGQHIVVCKMDAVFPAGDGVHIVDWKTGAEPSSPEELASKALQLAAYRLAWSQWSGLELGAIQASFWFSETKKLVTPETLATLDELEALVRQALGG